MTFPISFFSPNLFRAGLKRNHYITLLYTIVLFLVSPLVIILSNAQHPFREAIVGATENSYILNNYMSLFGGYHILSIMVFCVFAVVISCYMNSYLYQTRSVNLYHSLPYRRSQLYVTNYLSGIMTYLIPNILILLINTILFFAYGFWEHMSYLVLIKGFFSSLLFFTLLYSVSVFAATLSGNIVAQLGMILFVFFIVPAIEAMFRLCVVSWYPKIVMTQTVYSFEYSFPIQWLGEVSGKEGLGLFKVLYSIGYTLLFAVLGGIAYHYRKSEDCNKFYVYKWTKRLIKYMLTFLAALLSALLFSQIVPHSIFFLLVGTGIGAFLAFVVIQSVFEKSFKGMFANMKAFIPFLLVTMIFMVVVSQDLVKVNDYIPKRESIKQITVQLPPPSGESDYEKKSYVFRDNDNVDRLYQLLAEKRDIYDGYTSEVDIERVLVSYGHESGESRIKRIYYLDIDWLQHYIEQVYDTQEYQKQYTNMEFLNGFDKVSDITLQKNYSSSIYYSGSQSAKTKQMAIELMRILQKDMQEASWNDLSAAYPYASIQITEKSEETRKRPFQYSAGQSENYLIYSCYKNTIQYLKENYKEYLLLGENYQTEDIPLLRMYAQPVNIQSSEDTEIAEQTKKYGYEISITNREWIEQISDKAFSGKMSSYSLSEDTAFEAEGQSYYDILECYVYSSYVTSIRYHDLSDELKQEIKSQLTAIK